LLTECRKFFETRELHNNLTASSICHGNIHLFEGSTRAVTLQILASSSKYEEFRIKG